MHGYKKLKTQNILLCVFRKKIEKELKKDLEKGI